MKKQFFYLFIILLILIASLFISVFYFTKPSYVTIGKNSFILDDKPFFPKVLNYMSAIQTDKKNNFWIVPFRDYHNINYYRWVLKISFFQFLT